MQTVVGIFTSQAAAEHAAEQLCRLGIAREHIHFLIPGAALHQPELGPTSETEQPGMGPALGSVVGGAIGASSGMMTATVLSALIPGIGPVTAIGLAALSLLGLVGGTVAGAVAGGALEDALANGLPKDELYVYKDALRRGRTVFIVLVEDTDKASAARAALAQAGAESLDAARAQWWIGMRDAEAEAYHATGEDFARDEEMYRRGFEAALRAETTGKPYQEAVRSFRGADADVCHTAAFRCGYERGRAYIDGLTGTAQT
jgi:outer membrane lipoprotein SlyB